MPEKKSRSRDIDKITQRVERKIKRASQIEDPVRILIYGRAGQTKTRTAATAPNVLLVDINEKGTKSTKRDLDPNTFPVGFWSDLDDVYWYLAAGNHKFKSVAIDGVTAMQTLCMNFVLGDEASRDASRDPDMPSRQVWGKVGQLMKVQITNFRNLPMNVIFTAMERSRDVGEDEEDVQIVVSPECSPTVSKHLEAAVDIIGHISVREVIVKDKKTKKKVAVVRRRLLVGPSERYTTKDRTGLFGREVKNPNLAEMFNLVNSKEAKRG